MRSQSQHIWKNLAHAAVMLAIAMTTLTQSAKADGTAGIAPNPNIWVSAYYISSDAHSGRLPVSKIDFHAISCLIHFCIFPGVDGTIDQSRLISAADTQAVTGPAHAAGCKVSVCLGTADVATFRSDITGEYRDKFCHALVDFVVSRGYDGLDLDFEPLEDSDVPDYTVFVATLRNYLNSARPGLLLTAAVASEPKMFANIQGMMDQINLMTYDLSGPWPGFRSWYNSSLYGDPSVKMDDGSDYPSCDQMVRQFIDAGVAPGKLAIGMGFYGYVWTGVSGPRQSLKNVKGLSVDDGADYRVIMDKYFSSAAYNWDPIAHAPYLSIPAPPGGLPKFVSYDDARLCADKVAYAKQMGLGGVMIWELGGGFRGSQPAGAQDELLQSVKQAWLAEAPPAANTSADK